MRSKFEHLILRRFSVLFIVTTLVIPVLQADLPSMRGDMRGLQGEA